MSIHWYQLLFQIINFGILIFVLDKFLYKPIIKIVEFRNKKIEDSLKAAENNLKEKSTIEILKKKASEEAEKEAVKIIESAKVKAGQASKQIIDNAKEEAEKEVDKKLQLMTDKLNHQEKEIISRISELVIKTTAQVLKTSLTVSEQKKIVDGAITSLSKIK